MIASVPVRMLVNLVFKTCNSSDIIDTIVNELFAMGRQCQRLLCVLKKWHRSVAKFVQNVHVENATSCLTNDLTRPL